MYIEKFNQKEWFFENTRESLLNLRNALNLFFEKENQRFDICTTCLEDDSFEYKDLVLTARKKTVSSIATSVSNLNLTGLKEIDAEEMAREIIRKIESEWDVRYSDSQFNIIVDAIKKEQ